MQPDARAWDRSERVLQRVRQRVLAAEALYALAAGIALGGLAAGLARYLGGRTSLAAVAALVCAGSAATLWLAGRRARWSRAAIAARLEQRHREFHNVVVTAMELRRYPERAQPWVRERVSADADRLLSHVDSRREVRLTRPFVASAAAMAAAISIALGVPERTARAIRTALEDGGGAAIATPDLLVTLEPPSYTRLPVRQLTNPERIDALEGTRLQLQLDSAFFRSVRFGNTSLQTRLAGERMSVAVSLQQSGYLAVESGRGLTLIPVTVTPDRPPAIRVDRPGRDLLLPAADRSVGVEAVVTDDHGIADLSLRYTRVSGAGEQFDFREGELPLGVTERDRLSWRAHATLALSTLGLEPGDSLVYHFVARDERAGAAGTATSDTFFVEIAGPGQIAVEGVAMPPDRERYALSQQMIVLKIERLRQRERSLAPEVRQEQASGIAAEQRAVRANFVFLTGGEVEDEETEAEQSNEIQEGRLENTARREIGRAIEHMARTEQALADVATGTALQQARLAAGALQRAFGRNRYILRALARRDRVDPSRRLTGNLEGARDFNRSEAAPDADSRIDRIRSLFSSAMAAADDLAAGRPIASKLPPLAEAALAIDPANAAWQRVAQQLASARDRLAAGENDGRAEEHVREALRLIVAESQRNALTPAIVPSPSALRAAWAEDLTSGGSRR